MTDTPTREPLVGLAERLRERMAAASEQPWVYRPDKHDDWGWIRGVERDDRDIGPFRPIVANAKDSLVREEDMAAHRQDKTDPYGPNALLIVEAVNALPDLLTALEEQSRRVEASTPLDREKVEAKISGILASDPACNGRVCTGSIERIASLVLEADRRARTALSPSDTVKKGEGA